MTKDKGRRTKPGVSCVELTGRVIKAGWAEGEALVSPEPMGFFGGVDPQTGVVLELGHALQGQCVAGRVLVFPTGKGSTVGSYILYRLKKNGVAPAAMVNAESEPIVAVGAIISEIPMLDRVAIDQIATGDRVLLDVDRLWVERVEAERADAAEAEAARLRAELER